MILPRYLPRRDACYVNPDAADSIAVTVWMPLCDSTSLNGAMQYINGGHIGAVLDSKLRVAKAVGAATNAGRTLEHVREAGWRVPGAPPTTSFMILTEDRLPDGEVVTVEVAAGEMILSSNMIPHQSLPNHSDSVRLSFDWRMQDMRLPHGWARQAGSTAGKSEHGGCWRLSKKGCPGYIPDWQLLPGPDAASTALHPWSWIDDEGGFHRH